MFQFLFQLAGLIRASHPVMLWNIFPTLSTNHEKVFCRERRWRHQWYKDHGSPLPFCLEHGKCSLLTTNQHITFRTTLFLIHQDKRYLRVEHPYFTYMRKRHITTEKNKVNCFTEVTPLSLQGITVGAGSSGKSLHWPLPVAPGSRLLAQNGL